KSHFAVLYSVFKVHPTPSASSALLRLREPRHRPVAGTRPSTREVMLTKTRSEKCSSLFANLRVCGLALGFALPSTLDNQWWAEMDSNHRPLGYQPSALTS